MTIHKTNSDNTPSADDFYKYSSELTQPSKAVYCSYDYENEAMEFIIKYDTGGNICASPSALELQIINDVFTIDEFKFAIDSLKNNKAPGIDGILIGIIIIIFNYMIENNEFPDIWAQGLRSVLFKSGSRFCMDNYRGITILGTFAKLFEIALNNCLCFVKEFVEKKMFSVTASKKEVESEIIYSSWTVPNNDNYRSVAHYICAMSTLANHLTWSTDTYFSIKLWIPDGMVML